MLSSSQGPCGYAPGESCVHRLYPATKALIFLAAVVTLLAVREVPGLGLLAAGGCAAVAASRPSRAGAVGLVRLLIVLAFAAVLLNALFATGERLPGPGWAPLWPTYEGLNRGVVAALRLVAMASLAYALVTTTSPRELGEAVENSLGRIPVFRGAGLAVDVAGRFVPGFIGDARRVRAIRAVRVNASGLGLSGRLREAGSYVLPLMISAITRAERIADAMAARCYRGGRAKGPGRRLRGVDWTALALTGAVCAVALLAGRA